LEGWRPGNSYAHGSWSAHNHAYYSDRSEAKLSGPVQSILDKDPFFSTFLSFNRAGILTEMTRECIDEAACTDGPRSTSMKLKVDNSGRKMSAEEQDGTWLTRFKEAYSFIGLTTEETDWVQSWFLIFSN
jgi:hypothetical protein